MKRKSLNATMLSALALVSAVGAANPALAGASTDGASARAKGIVTAESQTSGRWIVPAGSSLKEVLETWGAQAGYEVMWDSDVDYRLRASSTFTGTYKEAASALIDSVHIDYPELRASFYLNKTLQVRKVLASH